MIIELEKKYEEDYKILIKELWNDITNQEIEKLINNHYINKEHILLFISIKENKAIGFANLSVRNEYVPGAEKSGVGYLEGIYVCKPYRRNQIAYKLIEQAKHYFKTLGFNQMASDTDISNEMSQIFHKSIGFKEVETCVHFIMNIENE